MRIRDILPPVASGVLLSLSFPSPGLWPLAFISLVPLLTWLTGKSYRAAFAGGVISGLVFHCMTFAWFASLTYWVGPIVFLGLGLFFVFFALFWGVVANGVVYVDVSTPRYRLLAVPAMWVLMEYVHNHILTGFGWGSVGYTQWRNLPAAQLASLGSVYAVSFYVVLVNVIIAEIVRSVREKKYVILLGLSLIAIVAGVQFWGHRQMREPDMSSSLQVGVIQPNFSLDVKWNSEFADHMFTQQRMLTTVAFVRGAELVVWPESALYGYVVEQLPKISRIVKRHKIHLLMGSNHYEEADVDLEDEILYYNSAFLISPDGEILDRYDKIHLAPFGEYVPLKQVMPFVDKVVPLISDFSPGKQRVLFDIGGKKFAVLICFENSFPHLVRNAAKPGADFLVQLTNDGWFGHTGQPEQDLAIAVFRAIENGSTLVRGTNTGISCFIDPWGRISGVVESSWQETIFIRGVSVERISTVSHDTFYQRGGDIWVVGGIVLLATNLIGCIITRPGRFSMLSLMERRNNGQEN